MAPEKPELRVGDVVRGVSPAGPPLDRYWRAGWYRVDAVSQGTWTVRSALRICGHRHRTSYMAGACASLGRPPVLPRVVSDPHN